MDIDNYIASENERPLDRIPEDGGFTGIFRTIGCVGDSLSSGEFESRKADGSKSYHDMFEYSWGQYIGRMVGAKVYNFSRGGMTAHEYWNGFAEKNGFWDEDKLCQAYIIALGVNDLINEKAERMGSMEDVNDEDYNQNGPGFVGDYCKIIARLKENQPRAKFFLMTMCYSDGTKERNYLVDRHAELLYEIAEHFGNAYVLDIRKYGPVHDYAFKKKFYLGGHLNPMGYMLTAKMVAAYIDYIIRNNVDDFLEVPFIGTDLTNFRKTDI